MSLVEMKGRWALVTGASRGIGYLAAMELARRGCDLILQSRSSEHLEKALIHAESLGVKAVPMACELSDPASVAEMLGRIDELGVPVDMILNNAGIQVAYRNEFLKTPPSDYEESFLVNTIGSFLYF